jgi:hypothetical protein
MNAINYKKGIVGALLLLVLCFASVFIVNEIFITEEGGSITDIVTTNESLFSEGYIEVNVRPRTIDLESEHVIVELDFIPHGQFDQGDGLLSTDIEVVASSDDLADFKFQAGRRMFPVEVEVSFYEGEIDRYPFDEHRALLEILVVESTSADGNWHSVPTKINFVGKHHSYSFVDMPLPSSEHGYLGWDIHMKRSPLVIGTAVFWMAIIWGLTVINILLFVGVLMGYVKADFSLFGYMSGFIVAMFFFREMFPNIPSFLGVFSDYLSVFWAILVAAGVAIVVAIKWLTGVFKNEDKEPDSIG